MILLGVIFIVLGVYFLHEASGKDGWVRMGGYSSFFLSFSFLLSAVLGNGKSLWEQFLISVLIVGLFVFYFLICGAKEKLQKRWGE